MQRWTVLLSLAVICCLFALGCSGGGPDPVTPPDTPDFANESPSLTGQSDAFTGEKGTYLWGYFDLYFDVEEMSVEAVPNRSGMFTANVTMFLNMNPAGLSFAFNGVTPNSGYVDVDVDISITHPLGLEKFNGYDVKGVFVGNGSGTMDYGGLMYPVAGTDQILMNADGYTRWFNPVEFGTSGLFGYTPGLYAAKNYTATATLNPYKYFGEGLGVNDDQWDYLTSGDPQVGYFIANSTNTRNYQLRFPIPAPGIKYGYAVVADWTSGQPSDHPSHCAEAVAVSVVDNSDLWYVDETTWGGEINLNITVFDWDAEVMSICSEEYWIRLETNLLSGYTNVGMPYAAPIDSGDHWYTYRVELTPENMTGVDGNEIWVIIEDVNALYDNPFGIPNDAETEPVAACFRFPLTVSSEQPPWIEVTSPNGGEQWLAGEDHEITWTSDGITSLVNLYYSIDNFVSDINTIAENEENDGTYQWEDIPGVNSGHVQVRVATASGPLYYDDSDHYFTIGSAWIDVIYPNLYEEFIPGSSAEIVWESESLSGTVEIEYSKDRFVSDINTIATGETNSGSFMWDPIPFDPSDTVRIRVSSTDNPTIFDTSDEDFEIRQSTISVNFPNGGETYTPGTQQVISWDTDLVFTDVLIEYSKDGFVSDINLIADNEEDDGTYDWTIPYDPSTTVTVRVSSVSFPSLYDVSDADFTIVQPVITVTSPNGGESWPIPGPDQEITWTSNYVIGTVDILISDDGFVSHSGVIGDGEENDGSYTLEDLPCEFSDTVRIRVQSELVPDVYDDSDADFSLRAAGWASSGGTANDEYPLRIAVDSEGCIYSGGYENVSGFTDINIVSLDPCGEYRWGYTWGGSNNQTGHDIAIDENDNVYLTGYFMGTNVDFDPTDGVDLHSSNYHWDCFVTSFDSDGNYRFTLTWGGSTGSDEGFGVCTDGSGYFYATGFFFGNVDFDPGPGTYFVDSGWYVNTYIVKFDTNGNFQWVKTWGGDGEVQGRRIYADSSGNVACTGYWNGTNIDFDPGTGSDLHTSSGGNMDIMVTVFDNMGNFQWANTWGNSGIDVGNDVWIDGSGNVFSVGYYQGTVDFDPDPVGTDDHTSGGETDAWLSMFDSTGDYLWAATWGGGEGDNAIGLCVLSGSYVYVTGNYRATVDFDPDPGDTDLRIAVGENDCFIAAYDYSGEYMWARDWGSINVDSGRGLAMVPSGSDFEGVYCVGTFNGSDVEFGQTGSPCFEPSDLHTSEGVDGFTMKLMYDGCW